MLFWYLGCTAQSTVHGKQVGHQHNHGKKVAVQFHETNVVFSTMIAKCQLEIRSTTIP